MNVGVASLVLIFAALCLTVFCTLSLVTASADLKLSRKTAQAIRDYYDADTRCVRVVGRINAAMNAGGALPEQVRRYEQDGETYLGFSERIDGRQTLEVLLRSEGDALEVVSWKAVTQETPIDDSVDVWDGETEGDSDNG